MKTIKIIVKDITESTVSNVDGLKLKLALDRVLSCNDAILLSFESITTLSSSFLNSSIGDIIENYGFDILKNRLKIINYTPIIGNTIVKYISDLRLIHRA